MSIFALLQGLGIFALLQGLGIPQTACFVNGSWK